MFPAQNRKTVTALAIALGAVLPATATAKPIGPDPSGASFTIPQSRVVRIITPASGFAWGDAGIGAAGALSLSMVVLGGGVAASQRRGRRTPTAQADLFASKTRPSK
jgi:hypothetical protein